MLLEVCGQYRLDDEEAKALELHVIQVDQEVELGPGQVEAPGGRSVVVLQHRPIVVEHCLHVGGREWSGERGACKNPSISSEMSAINVLA